MVAAIDIKIEVLIEFLNDLDTDCKEQNEFTCFVFDQNGFIIGPVIKQTQIRSIWRVIAIFSLQISPY